ncbi:MAG TPA: putative porin [Terriglobales bacterium]|nr:putative porin [Terriglobales bacterium]
MKAVLKIGGILLLASSLFGQTAAPAKKAARKPASTSAADIQALKDAVAAQQQQIQTLQQQLQQTNQQLQQSADQYQKTQQQLQQAQQTAADAQQKAASLESSVANKDSVDKLNAQYADIQTTLTNNAVSAQDEQKRMTGLENTLGRFRWTGDIRIRGEDFFQTYSGCTACADRNRVRVRVRFGFEGKLNDDFNGGIALATGSLGDPTTTNETFTNNFDRKTIGLDKAFITFNPVAHRWLSITAGKFVYQWQRTSVTGDPDTNPEGFDIKFSKDFSSVPVVKNANIQFMQLFYNEANGTSGLYHGHDSYAVGGQIGGRLQLTKFWTMTPSFLVLNWRYPDSILNSNFFATQATTTNNINVVDTSVPPKVISFPISGEGPGCSTPGSSGLQSSQACAFAPNGMTNSTYVDVAGHLHFLSGFLYADVILNNTFKTKWSRLPLNLLVEYENNLNASSHPFDNTVKGTVPDPGAVVRTDLGSQSHVYYADFSVGQQKTRGDIQVGYAFLRHEQDATIASFNESDQRAPSNIVQHRIYALWRIRQNTTAGFTWWHGRTLDPFLQNSVLAAGMKTGTTPGVGIITPGQTEPWLNRLQFDLIYTF